MKLKHRAIATSVNCSAGTVSNVIRLATLADIKWPLPDGLTEDLLHGRLYPKQPHPASKTRPDYKAIHQQMSQKGMTLVLLWEEYKSQYGEQALGYTRFCEEYRRFVKTVSPVMRQTHIAGEKCFVDYAGTTMPWLNPETGEIEYAQILVGCLGASNYTFVYASKGQTLPEWIEAHVKMFKFFGGVPQCLIPDNLASGVTKAHHYDPDINATYQQMAEYYGTAVIPARVRKPRDKASVESVVGYVTRQLLMALRHHTFTSIAEINARLRQELITFNQRPFQKIDGTRLSRFEQIDKPALKTLPIETYHIVLCAKARVNVDYHIVYEHHYYSVPYRLIHKVLDLRINKRTLECFYKGERVAIHPLDKSRYQHSTLKEHMPLSHRAHATWTPERLSQWAAKTGVFTKQFIEKLIASRAFPQQAFRACLGVLRFADKYGTERLENACQYASEIGATRYKQLESILKNNMDCLREKAAEPSRIIEHENIRGPNYYQQ